MKVIATVTEEALPDMQGVAARLAKTGLVVESLLEITGQIIGTCPPQALEALRRIEGVADVAESREIQLPPPGSMIQ